MIKLILFKLRRMRASLPKRETREKKGSRITTESERAFYFRSIR
jgi:hypothetical protein